MLSTRAGQKVPLSKVLKGGGGPLGWFLKCSRLSGWNAMKPAVLPLDDIYAPQPGLVVYYSDRYRRSSTMIDVGAKVFQNQKLLELPDMSIMKLLVRIHEADAVRIKVGLPATIRLPRSLAPITMVLPGAPRPRFPPERRPPT